MTNMSICRKNYHASTTCDSSPCGLVDAVKSVDKGVYYTQCGCMWMLYTLYFRCEYYQDQQSSKCAMGTCTRSFKPESYRRTPVSFASLTVGHGAPDERETITFILNSEDVSFAERISAVPVNDDSDTTSVMSPEYLCSLLIKVVLN